MQRVLHWRPSVEPASVTENSRVWHVAPPLFGAGPQPENGSAVLTVPVASVTVSIPSRAPACVTSFSSPKRLRAGVSSLDTEPLAPCLFDPLWGPRLCAYVALFPFGSFQRTEALKDAREGFLFANFVQSRPWPRPESGF